MKTSFDTDSILYGILNVPPVRNAISGGIYVGDTRPEVPDVEDIVINTVTVTSDTLPQTGTSNVNIYVPDTVKTVGGKSLLVANRIRMKALLDKVMAVLGSAQVEGLKIVPESQTTMAETSLKQHFVNIRISWNIQIQ